MTKRSFMKYICTLILSLCITTFSYATIHIVTAGCCAYTPSELEVSCGDTVRFQWLDHTHPTVSETAAWSTFTLDEPTPEFDVVLSDEGTYAYYCSNHGAPGGIGMSGTITVTCAPPPSCDIPTGLNAVNITTTTAKILWTAVPGATQYLLQYRKLGALGWKPKQAFGPSKKINKLKPNTTYEYEVQAVCPSGSSEFSAISTFTTLPMRMGDAGSDMLMDIYPNPNSGEFTLNLANLEAGELSIRVYDIDGKEVYHETMQVTAGTLTKKIILPAGYKGLEYIVISNNGHTATRTISVQ